MDIDDITIGQTVEIVFGGARNIGIVRAIDYDLYEVTVEVAIEEGCTDSSDWDPADLRPHVDGDTSDGLRPVEDDSIEED